MANMNFVPITDVFLLFVSIATLYVKPILGNVLETHKFLCDWDPINEVVDIRKCKPYAAQSPQEPQQIPQAMVVPSKPSEVTEVACRTERSESSEQCACFFQCSMIIVGILTVFALLALLIATYVAGCQMMMAIK
uniref:Uncharacterized protein n=1 Tax=Globodera pallida TaxID=36090 RepID=A0A183C8W0_GLOPA